MLPIEVDVASKFQVTRNFQQPGTCISCGRTCQDQEYVVDLGEFKKFYGRIYQCFECIRSLAAIFNFITPEKYEELSNELANKDLAYVTLEKENYNLKQVIDGYRNLGSLASGDFSSAFNGAVLEESFNSDDVEQSSEDGKDSEEEIIEVREEETQEGTDGEPVPAASYSAIDDGESVSTEFSDIERPTNIRSDPSSTDESDDEFRDIF